MNIPVWGSARYPSAAAWLVLAVAAQHPYGYFLTTCSAEFKVQISFEEVQDEH